MAYEVHITRADDWTESGIRPIAASEWESLVAVDPELRFESEGATGSEGEALCAIWRDERAWFRYFEGEIVAAPRDRATFEKTLAIADRLGAKVIGDDGELYAGPDDIPELPGRPMRASETTGGEPPYLGRQRRGRSVEVLLIAIAIAGFFLYRRFLS